MKKYHSLTIIIFFFAFLFLSCDGKFEAAKFAINLEYPELDSKCEKGTPNGNFMTLPFQWKPQGDITNFSLVLNDDIISITPNELDGDILEFKFDVEYSETYSWKIISGDIESEVRKFTTPSSEENNNDAPFPVVFNEAEYSASGISISWSGGDADINDIIRYDVYWHINDQISSEIYTDKIPDLQNRATILEIPNFDANKEYFILVIAKDDKNNKSFSIKKFCQFCTD